jgi:hypothetical protein
LHRADLDQLACSSSVTCLGGTAESWASGGRALLATATADAKGKALGFV